MGRAHANRRFALALIFALFLAACATSDFGRRFDEAERLRQQAAEQGYEWLDTSGLLEEAQEQASRGETDKALELVEAARFQAAAALEQAHREAEAWRHRVPQ